MAKIIAVDFDGTLCENCWPGIGAEKEPVTWYVKRRKDAGAKLILWTNRKGEQLEEAVRWCAERGITFDAVNENLPEIVKAFGGDTRTVYADDYLDDKMVPLPEKTEGPKRGRFRR